MTPPSDNQRANDKGNTNGPNHAKYEMLGHFEPGDAERILKGLEEQHLSFEVQEYSELRYSGSHRLLCIYVRPEDKKEAEAISDRNPVRSRAAAGICYMAVAGIICTTALLLMRSGVRTIDTVRDGRIPLEMIAGIAGIVVFIGFLQLVIAIIFKLRGRQRSHLVKSMRLTNR
jgi:hypothetical protein